MDEAHRRVLMAGLAYERELRAFGESMLTEARYRMRYQRPEDYAEHIAALARLGADLDAALDGGWQDAGRAGEGDG